MLGNAVITFVFLILCDINIHLGTQLSVFCISFFLLLCLGQKMFRQSEMSYRRNCLQPPCCSTMETRPAYPITCQKPPTSSCITRKRYLGRRLYISLASPIRPDDENYVNQPRVNHTENRDDNFVNQRRIDQAEYSEENCVHQHRIKQSENGYANFVNQSRINQAKNSSAHFVNQHRINQAEYNYENLVNQHRINETENSDDNFVNQRRINQAEYNYENLVNQHRINQAENSDDNFVNQRRINQAENSKENFVHQHRIKQSENSEGRSNEAENSYANCVNQHRINQTENSYAYLVNQRRSSNQAETICHNFVNHYRANQAENNGANFVNNHRNHQAENCDNFITQHGINLFENSDSNFVNQQRINQAENSGDNFVNQHRINQAENCCGNFVNEQRINQAENSGDNFVNQHRINQAENCGNFVNQRRINQAENSDGNFVNRHRVNQVENCFGNFAKQSRIKQAENNDANFVSQHRINQAENNDDNFVNQHRIIQAENRDDNFVNQRRIHQAENNDANFVNQRRINQAENNDANFVNQHRINQAENRGDNFVNQLRFNETETVLYSESLSQHCVVESHVQANEHCPVFCHADESRPQSRSCDLVSTAVTRFVSVETKLMQLKGGEQIPKSYFHSEAETNFISDMESTAYFEQEISSSSSESSGFVSPFPSDTSHQNKNQRTKSRADEVSIKKDQKVLDGFGASTDSKLQYWQQYQASEVIECLSDGSLHSRTCNETHSKVTSDAVKTHSTSPHSTSCLIKKPYVEKNISPSNTNLETKQQKIMKNMEMKNEQLRDSDKLNRGNVACKELKVHPASPPLQQIPVTTLSKQRQMKTNDKSNMFQNKLRNVSSMSLNQKVTRTKGIKEHLKSRNKKILTSQCRQAAVSKYYRFSQIKPQDDKTLSGISSFKSVSKLSTKSKEVSLQLGTDSSQSVFMEEKSLIPFPSPNTSSDYIPQSSSMKQTSQTCKCCSEISTVKSSSADDKVNHTQPAKTSKVKNISRRNLTKRTKLRNAMTSPLVTMPSRKSQSSNGRLQVMDKKVMTSPALTSVCQLHSSTLSQEVSPVSSKPLPPVKFTGLDFSKNEQPRFCKASMGPGDLSCNISLDACPSVVVQFTSSPLTKSLQSHRANQESNTPTSEWSFELSCEIQND